jgi:hypothetical protein
MRGAAVCLKTRAPDSCNKRKGSAELARSALTNPMHAQAASFRHSLEYLLQKDVANIALIHAQALLRRRRRLISRAGLRTGFVHH